MQQILLSSYATGLVVTAVFVMVGRILLGADTDDGHELWLRPAPTDWLWAVGGIVFWPLTIVGLSLLVLLFWFVCSPLWDRWYGRRPATRSY